MADIQRTLTPEEIIAILARGAFNELRGVFEGDRFDAKSKPYPIDKAYGKLELAKDVVSFANSRGGIIIIGAKTAASSNHLDEAIASIHPFPQGLVNREQYHAVLKDWVYPGVEDLDISWHPWADDSNRGVVAISIPNQADERRPFLVAKTIDEDSNRQIGLLFGYVERRLAGNDPTHVQELHTWLKDGKRFDNLTQRFDSVDEALRVLRSSMPSGERAVEAPPVSTEALEQRIHAAIEAVDLPQGPAFYLATTTLSQVEIDGLFSATSTVTKALNNPPSLRRSGFDLRHEQTSKIVEAECRRSVLPKFKLLEICQDGAVIFVVEAHRSPCYWGSHGRELGLIVNPLALSETVYVFVEFTRIVFSEAKPIPRAAVYRLGFHNLGSDNHPLRLMSGPLTTWGWQGADNLKSSPKPTHEFKVSWPHKEISTGQITYLLVREVYRWFGFDDNEIPYVLPDGANTIDPDEFNRPLQY